MRNKANKVIAILIILLIIVSGLFIKGLLKKNKSIPTQKITDSKLDDLYYQQDKLNNTFKQANKLVVLDGNLDIQYTFSNKSKEVLSHENSNCVKWIKEKIIELTLSGITYKTNYTYSITYPLNELDVKVNGDILEINVAETYLQLDNLAENKNKTDLTTDKGLLASDFKPSEVNSMSKFVYTKAYNKVINSEDVRNSSIDNLENNIKDICDKLGIKNYKVIIHKNNVMEYQDDNLK